MTHGTIAGILLTDLIMKRANPWADLYDPSRKTLVAAKEVAHENVNVAAQYTDLFTPGDIDSVDEIPKGEGAILRSGLSQVAVYRDEDGTLHNLSAVCIHLGCIVTWNSAEKTWDCPCHGSRYEALGTVINGPANSDLPLLGTSRARRGGPSRGKPALKPRAQLRPSTPEQPLRSNFRSPTSWSVGLHRRLLLSN